MSSRCWTRLIGGTIAADHTPLPGATLSLARGDYLVQVYGAFEIPSTDGGPIECDLFGTTTGLASAHILGRRQPATRRRTYDGGEGLISPNVVMPDCNERHANVSGEFVISLDATTSVGLVGFGYTDDDSDTGSGMIQGGGGLIVHTAGDITVGGDTSPSPSRARAAASKSTLSSPPACREVKTGRNN